MAREDSLAMMVIDGIVKWLKTRHAVYSIVGTIALLAALAWLFSYQAQAFPAADPYNVGPIIPGGTGPSNAEYSTESLTGTANEGSSVEEPFSLQGDVIWIMEVTFTFTDEEPDRARRFTNEPDSFDVTVTFPDGESQTKSATGSNTNPGTIQFAYNWTADGGMEWSAEDTVVITVELTQAGEQHPLLNPFGLREVEDSTNDYSLSVYYGYTQFD
jgi:hypothetical protein